MAAHKAAFKAAKHSRVADLDSLTAGVEANFIRLDKAFASRLARLEDALAFRRFEASVKEEDEWIRERARNAASHVLGDSVTATDRLLAKHKVRARQKKYTHTAALQGICSFLFFHSLLS